MKPPPAKLSIAWVGNSFVYFNDLPSMLATLLLCAKPFPGTTVEYDSVAPGGQRFAGHADDTAVAGMLRRRAWDVVVLQDNSGVPGGYDSGRFAESAYALTDRLAPLTRDSLVCLLYGTWGHRFGSVYAEQQAAYPDYKTMQKLTTHGIDQYKRLLDRTQSCGTVGVAPVGDAWERIYDEDVRAKRESRAPPLTARPTVQGSLRLFRTACGGLSSLPVEQVQHALHIDIVIGRDVAPGVRQTDSVVLVSADQDVFLGASGQHQLPHLASRGSNGQAAPCRRPAQPRARRSRASASG